MKLFPALFLSLCFGQSPETISIGGPTSPDGRAEISTELPQAQRIRNIGSHVDGAGMCVMSSIEMAARYQNLEQLRGLRDWCARQPGGGYPTKVDRQLREFCQQRHINVPRYIQYEGGSMDIMKLALRTGRMVAVTYSGRDRVRYSGSIAHMVCLVHLDDNWACISDNNAIGDNEFLWMSPAEFKDRWASGGGGWAFIFLTPPPPPAPRADGNGIAPAPRPVPDPAPTPNRPRPRPNPAEEVNVIGQYEAYWLRSRAGDTYSLVYRGRTIGVFVVESQTYYDIQGNITQPPFELPNEAIRRPRQPAPTPEVTDYGMQWRFEQERFSLNGEEIPMTSAVALVRDGTVPDDTSLLRLTIIGTAEQRQAVRNDLESNPELAVYKDKILVMDYAPDHWTLQCGFFTQGSPTIYVQRANGEVLHRQDDYNDGPTGLATALRRIDPNYQPNRDQDQRRSLVPGVPNDTLVIGGLVLIAGFLVYKGKK